MKNRTYRYYHGEVLYPFGYGLSYSRFSFARRSERQSITGRRFGGCDRDVRNTSEREGDEVAELYIKPPQIAVSPQLSLRASRESICGQAKRDECSSRSLRAN